LEHPPVNSETELVKRAREGDPSALSEIVEAHQHRIYGVALRMCGNAQDAEETMQDTFLSAIEALPRFEGRSQLSTWLYRIASNACLMRRRKEASRARTINEADSFDGDEGAELPTYFVDWSYLPDDVVLDRELQEFLERAILQLPPALRLTFIWRELEGLSTAETAAALEISEGAVKVRLHRARLKLRELLSSYFVDRGIAEGQGNGLDGKVTHG
jgi:RNA polymerase sigma-70 factor (ECF subfamily)